jgi:hypothetical protein
MVEKDRIVEHPRRSADRLIQSEGSHAGTPDAPYERTDARPTPVFRVGLLLLVALGVGVAAVAGFLHVLERRAIANDPPPHPLAAPREIPPEPRLQTSAGVDAVADAPRPEEPFTNQGAAEHEKRQAEELSTYGWVDRATGAVRIPVERALELVLEEGLPSAGQGAGPGAGGERR